MRFVVAGGTGLIGTRLVEILGARGHDALAASPATGIDIPSALTAYFTVAAQNPAATGPPPSSTIPLDRWLATDTETAGTTR